MCLTRFFLLSLTCPVVPHSLRSDLPSRLEVLSSLGSCEMDELEHFDVCSLDVARYGKRLGSLSDEVDGPSGV